MLEEFEGGKPVEAKVSAVKGKAAMGGPQRTSRLEGSGG